MFAPILEEGSLPSVGRNERRSVDFKSIASDDPYEVAKDVAAFANADGGTLLLGAKGSGEFLASYEPLSAAVASKAQREYEAAIRARCSPVPLFDLVGIPRDGGFVVAVNVWPFPGQLVGVEVKKGEAKCGRKGAEPEGLYFFPLRVGAQTTSITPEQMPMFMDARARRVAICLQQAIGQKLVMSSVRQATGPASGIKFEVVRLDDVDLLGNAIAVTVECDGHNVPLGIPLDLIEAAWREKDRWRVLVRGRIERVNWRPDLGEPELERLRLFLDVVS